MVDSADTADGDLDQFLSRCQLLSEDGVIWAPRLRFTVRAYASTELPPLNLITSVRCVVTRPGEVLTVGSGSDSHVVPGGRREPGETLEESLRREVLEETGWALTTPRLLGCVVYRHVEPQPADYAFPYPRFVQLVFVATTKEYHPDALRPDQNDGEARFRPIDAAQRLPMAAMWQAFLRLATVPQSRFSSR